jgi:imidazolonepropionase-like amidohydrolase
MLSMLQPILLVGLLASTGLPTGAGLSAPLPEAGSVLVFKSPAIHLGDGRVIEDGVLVADGGVIRRIGKGIAIPEGARVVEHDGPITPGLIALFSHDGCAEELFDQSRPVLEGAEMLWAFRPMRHDLWRALGAGITTVVLGPTRSGLCPGVTAVVKTHGGKVVSPRAQLFLGFSHRSLRGNEFPTSFASARERLEQLLDEGQGAFGQAASGNLPVLLDADERDQIQRAIAFAQARKLKGALLGSHWTEELADAIKAAGLAVVCNAADPGQAERNQRSILALAKAGVPFGFALGAPERSHEALRFAAALAIRAGLEPGRALQALTGDPARIAGVAGRVGTLASGLDADLVLWSGDPTDLASRPVAVYVDGVLARGERE